MQTSAVAGDMVSVRLPYGTDRDWVRNLTAAGGGVVVRCGRKLAVTDPQVSKEGRVGILRLRVSGPV